MTAPLNDAELAAMKALLAAATPGPWRWDSDPDAGEWGHRGPDLVQVTGDRTECKAYCHWIEDGVEYQGTGPESPHSHKDEPVVISSWGYDADGLDIGDADAAFIAAAPESMARLIGEVERYRGVLREISHYGVSVPLEMTPEAYDRYAMRDMMRIALDALEASDD